MTRVASFSHNQSMVSGILRNQSEMFTAQRQVNTGKKAEDYKGLGGEASTLIAARSLKSRTESFLKSSQQVSGVLQTQEVQLGGLVGTARSVKEAVLTAIANGNGIGLRQTMEQDYGIATAALNTKIGGSFIFGGSRTATPPFTGGDFAAMVATPTVGDLFVNDELKASARVADGVEISYGVLAQDVGQPLMEALQRLAQFDGPPPGVLSGTLTPDQISFLEGELATLETVVQGVQSYEVANGLAQARLDDLTTQMDERRVYLENFVSDIEDVDIAEAITRLKNDQTALEASYRVMSTLTQLSLSDFI